MMGCSSVLAMHIATLFTTRRGPRIKLAGNLPGKLSEIGTLVGRPRRGPGTLTVTRSTTVTQRVQTHGL